MYINERSKSLLRSISTAVTVSHQNQQQSGCDILCKFYRAAQWLSRKHIWNIYHKS